MERCSFNDLGPDDQSLVDQAIRATSRAYCPYSHFAVGAALRCVNGTIIFGVNVENVAFGVICAERSAICSARSQGLSDFEAIAVTAIGASGPTRTPVSPCGACRQALYEASQVAGRDIKVICASGDKDQILLTSIHELLPNAFGAQEFGVDIGRYQLGNLKTLG